MYFMRKIRVFLMILIILNIVGIFVVNHFSNYDENSSRSYIYHRGFRFYNDLEQKNDEWELIGNQIFIRRPSVIYYEKDASLRMLVLMNNSFKDSIKLLLRFSPSQILKGIDFTLENIYRAGNYSVYLLKSKLSKKISYLDCAIRDGLDGLTSIIPVTIRPLVQEKKTKRAILCARFYTFNEEDFETVETWIKINRKINYSKIIVYKHLIHDSRFDTLFEKNKDLIELRNYEHIPIIYKNINMSLSSDIKLVHSWMFAHEKIVLNECYQSEAWRSTYVANMDFDEIILPFEYNSDKKLCKYDIYSYLDNIKTDLSINYSISFWYSYALFIDSNYVNNIFQSIKKSLIDKNVKFNTSISIQTEYIVPDTNFSRKIEFSIESKNEFEHALSLYTFYKNHYSNNSLFDDTYSTYNRVFMLKNNYPEQLGYGKSIHETDFVRLIGAHQSVSTLNRMKIPYKYGHASHFRRILNYWTRKFSITQLEIDYNYFNCILSN